MTWGPDDTLIVYEGYDEILIQKIPGCSASRYRIQLDYEQIGSNNNTTVMKETAQGHLVMQTDKYICKLCFMW